MFRIRMNRCSAAVPTRRPARLLLTLSMVLAAHLALVWLLLSTHYLLVKSRPGSLQLVWIRQRALSEVVPESSATIPGPSKTVPPQRIDHPPDSPSIAPPPREVEGAIHPAPDWNAELQLAAKDAIAKELEQRKHDSDFAHVFPTQPKKPPQIAWDYAATHRIEALPQGGLLIHINDNCVLLIFPLPLVGCAIGKRSANGDLFESMHEK